MMPRDEKRGGFTGRLVAGKSKAPKAAPRVQTMGELILQIAEALKPGLEDELDGVRDEHGMPVQPARVRGIAIIIAQELVKAKMNGSRM